MTTSPTPTLMNTAQRKACDTPSQRVCLVTEELSGVGSSGGIGAAFLELAQLLANQGCTLDVLYCPIAGSLKDTEHPALATRFATQGIKLSFLDPTKWVTEPVTCEKRSYAVARWLQAVDQPYDVVHFHDYKGLGFFPTALKRQGLAFAKAQLVVQLHGPTRWAMEANRGFFSHEDQLKIDHMERLSIAQADSVVSPSAYLLQWLKDNGFTLPKDARVIKNVCSDLSLALQRYRARTPAAPSGVPATDIVFFARHEDRKGFAVFCDALDAVQDELADAKVTVTFLGKFGAVDCQPSGVFLVDRAKTWRFPIRIRSGLARNEAVQYILTRHAPVVVIPSPAENSPYTVLESILLGVPVISSLDGGGPELFADRRYAGLCNISSSDLAALMMTAVTRGLPAPVPSETSAQIDQHWLAFHAPRASAPAAASVPARQPLVTFAITHHERPKKLVDAILSAVCQTYANFEILVVDDGSSKPTTVQALEQVDLLLKRVGGRLVRQQNAYLGAARNTAVREARGEYICFLDDDDIAVPELLQTLVTAIVSTGADAVNCLNIFMEESLRSEVLARSDKAPAKVSYVPLAGPLALAPTENCIGAATAIFRKSALLAIGGYSELRGVGHEDYELYLRLLQAGKQVLVTPVPLYFYEVGRPSMLSRTSMSRNFRRCFDVVDTTRNAASWKDMVALNVGKTVVLHSHNRQWWLYSLTRTAELRHKVLRGGLDRSTLLRTLIDLADAEGAARLKAAFADDLAHGDVCLLSAAADAAKDLDEVIVSEPAPPTPLENADPALLDCRLSLALGRHGEAMRALSTHLQTLRVADEGVSQLVKQLLGNSAAASVAPAAWQALGVALRGCRVSKASKPALARVAMSVAIKARDLDAVKLLLKAELDAADAQYLRNHSDVEACVKDGLFTSGLEHFLRIGKEEGRKGFAVLDSFADLALGDPELSAIADGFCTVAAVVEA